MEQKADVEVFGRKVCWKCIEALRKHKGASVRLYKRFCEIQSHETVDGDIVLFFEHLYEAERGRFRQLCNTEREDLLEAPTAACVLIDRRDLTEQEPKADWEETLLCADEGYVGVHFNNETKQVSISIGLKKGGDDAPDVTLPLTTWQVQRLAEEFAYFKEEQGGKCNK